MRTYGTDTVQAMRGIAVDPERLRLARQLRGITQSALAADIDATGAAISQFERGHVAPSAPTLERVALALKVTPRFLTRPAAEIEAEEPFFRALARTSARERDKAEAYARVLAEISELLDRYVALPEPRIRILEPVDEATPLERIEHLAQRARAVWGLPPGPIADVVNLAETRGVVVAAVGVFDEQLDAFSLRVAHRQVIVLCTGKGNTVRRRFDCAHELGHLALHRQRLRDTRRMEAQAHRFAAALLMPALEVEPDLPRRPGDLSVLEQGSKRWGVSMQALLYRAKDLGLLTIDGFTRSMKRLSAAGWRTREPVEVGPPERPELLRRAVAALPAAGTSLREIAEQAGLPVGRLARMLALPEEFDDARRAPVLEIARALDRSVG